MTGVMDEDEITQRLRDSGNRPVPGEVRSSHLSRMHAARPTVQRPTRFGRVAVAAAAFAGFAVGSTGFAIAGALPEPAQQVAHDVLATVNVDVEDPKNRGQCISAAARSTTDEAAKQEAKAKCPKGGKGNGRPDGAGPSEGKGAGKGRPDHAGNPGGPNGAPHPDDPCTGPPPWAGKAGKAMGADAKRAAQDARAACPDEDPDDEFDDEVDDEVDDEREAPEVETDEEAPAEPQDQAPPAGQRQADPPAPAPDATTPGPPADEDPGPPDETPAPPAPGDAGS